MSENWQEEMVKLKQVSKTLEIQNINTWQKTVKIFQEILSEILKGTCAHTHTHSYIVGMANIKC
jgi:hypothetical protein